MKEVSMELLEDITCIITANDLSKTVRVIQYVFYQTLTDYSISELSQSGDKGHHRSPATYLLSVFYVPGTGLIML